MIRSTEQCGASAAEIMIDVSDVRRRQSRRWLGLMVATALVALAITPVAARSQGLITGCVTDGQDGALPGVEVTLSGPGIQQRAVTDSSGCFRFAGLPAETYSVAAALAGFVSARRDGIQLRDGHMVSDVNFALCMGRRQEILWVQPGGLAEAWHASDIVAYVRIVATGPVVGWVCPTEDFLHTAHVIESFKESQKSPTGLRLAFRQENWGDERTPYPIGQKMVVFLVATEEGLLRLAGPFYVFRVDGDEVVSYHSPVKTDGMTAADFLSKLRGLAQERKVP